VCLEFIGRIITTHIKGGQEMKKYPCIMGIGDTEKFVMGLPIIWFASSI
jgi:hypothetical protein